MDTQFLIDLLLFIVIYLGAVIIVSLPDKKAKDK